MNLDLRNQVVLVSGSSRGIGRAIAAAFLREGARVALSGRGADALHRTAAELAAESHPDQVLALPGDLTEAGTIARALQAIGAHWGPIDILVANLGTGKGRPGWEADEAEWDSLLEANLRGAVRLVSAALTGMTERKKGSIVLINSIVGLESTGAPLAYSAAKAGLLNYAKNLARRLGPLGVRVNTVAPGNIFFPGGTWEKHLETRREAVLAHIEEEVPLKRFGTPEEIADLAVFLSSPRAAFVTGACLVADGGQTRSL